jgi:hypothetical protein
MTHPESSTLFSPGLLSGAIDSALQLGERLTRSVGGLTGRIGDEVRLLSDCSPAPSCSCRPPQACWLPNELPLVSSVVPSCGTARIRFKVHNCGLATRRVFVAATGIDASLASGAPSVATIGALETAEVVADVTASEQGCAATHQISIDDCPGTWHHWSDHFQQPRPCGSAHHG